MMKTAITWSLIFLLMVLSACGWRLRGSETLDVEHNIYLAPASGQVYETIKRALTRKKAEVSIAEADIQLILMDEIFNRRTASVNNQLKTAQYQLTLSVSYEIADPSGKPLVAQTAAELSRYYTFNQNAITGSDREEQTLRKEMVRQLSRQILQRVRFLLGKSSTE